MQIDRFPVKQVYVLVIIGLFFGLTIFAIVTQPPTSLERAGSLYLEELSKQMNISNSVYGIYGMYRFYDTLLELLIFSMAVLGITIFSDLGDSEKSSHTELMESHVVDSSASFLYPIIFLFGIYLAYSAHQGPGGGFAGGVIAGTGVLLLAIAIGADRIGQLFYEQFMKKVEYLILLLVLAIVLLGLISPVDIYTGNRGVGVIILANLAMGTKVFIGTWTVLHFFVKHRGEI